MRAGRSTLLLGVAALLAASHGCQAPGSPRRGLNSANPFERARAAVAAAESGDTHAVHALVDLLEDQDKAVRMYAAEALRRLCGEDYGYHYYESDGERAVAVERWRAALRAGSVTVHSGEPEGRQP